MGPDKPKWRTCGSRSWVKVMGGRRLRPWVKVVGQSHGSRSWVKVVGQGRGSRSWVVVGQGRGLRVKDAPVCDVIPGRGDIVTSYLYNLI